MTTIVDTETETETGVYVNFCFSGLKLPIGERTDRGLSDRLLQRGFLQNLRI